MRLRKKPFFGGLMWASCDLCRKKIRGSIGGNSKAFDTFVVEG
jgi:hypothetical protein